MILLCAQGILQIKRIDPELVRHHHINIIRHSAGNPVMTADRLQPPDLVFIRKSYPVHLVSTVFFQQASQPRDTFSGTVNIREHHRYNVLLTDTSGNLFCTVLRRNIFHQRICSQNSCVGSDGFRGSHAHTCRVDTVRRPDAFSLQRVGHCGITQSLLGQIDLHVRKYGSIFFRLFFRMYHHEFLRGKLSGGRIIVPGDHGRSVIRCFFSY